MNYLRWMYAKNQITIARRCGFDIAVSQFISRSVQFFKHRFRRMRNIQEQRRQHIRLVILSRKRRKARCQ